MAISAGLDSRSVGLRTVGAAAMRVGEVSCGFKSALSPYVLSRFRLILGAIKILLLRRWRDNASLQRMGLHADDLDHSQRADQRRRPLSEHGLHIWRAADDLTTAPTGLL